MVDGSADAGIPGCGNESLSCQVGGSAKAGVKYSSRCDIGGGYDNRLSVLSFQAATGKSCAMPALTDRGDRPEVGHRGQMSSAGSGKSELFYNVRSRKCFTTAAGIVK